VKENTMTDVESWLAFMSGLVVAYRRPDVDHKALAAHLNNLMPLAAPKFKQLGVVKPDVITLVNMIGQGKAPGKMGMPNLAYAQKLTLFRKYQKPALAKFFQSADISESQVNLAKVIMAMLVPDTLTVDRKDAIMDKKIVVVPDRMIRMMFDPPKQHNQAAHLAEATRLVQKLAGRKGSRLSQIEGKAAKEKNPELYKRYLQVNRDVTSSYTDFVRSAARAAGHPVLISTLIRDMAKAGIKYHGYDGIEKLYLGEDGKLYTPPPYREILASVAPGSRVIMNPKYDPKTDDCAVFQYQVPGSKRDANSMSSAYTRSYVIGRKNQRFDLVAKTTAKIPNMRPRWVKDLRSGDPRTRMLAAMTEMLYSQAMRIGGAKNNVDGKTTYGLSTLLVNHVNIRNGNAIITYPGKDAIQQKHVLRSDDATLPETKLVIQILQKLITGKKGTAFVWTDPTGERITSSDVNAYMRGKKLGISAHKFRHIRGSELMTKALSELKIPKNANQQQVEKLVKQEALKVGMLLGHMSGEKATSATAIKSYINPSMLVKFFADKQLRIPQWIPRGGRGTTED
jgi:hypothetical protein